MQVERACKSLLPPIAVVRLHVILLTLFYTDGPMGGHLEEPQSKGETG